MFVKILLCSLALLQLSPFGQSQCQNQDVMASLNQCGEQNNVDDSNGDNFNYKFYCPSGYECVNRVRRNQAGAVAKSVVDRCSTKSKQCEKNLNLTAKCGFSFTRCDQWTYYFNCAGNCDYAKSQCSNNASAIITRCNVPDLYVMGGHCQNTFPSNLKCEQVVP